MPEPPKLTGSGGPDVYRLARAGDLDRARAMIEQHVARRGDASAFHEGGWLA